MEGVRVGRNTWKIIIAFILSLETKTDIAQITYSYGRTSYFAKIDIPKEIVNQQLFYANKMIFYLCKYQFEKSHDLKLNVDFYKFLV